MNTAITPRFTVPTHTPAAERRSPMRRFFGVVGQAQSYRSIGYLLLGLVLATAWLTLLVTALSVSLSLVVVALLGIPLLLGTWYAVRAFANIERGLANVLLGQHLRPAPLASRHRGNVWVRLVAMSRERSRWRELAYLFVRIPVGIATFAIAMVALAVPFAVIWAPIEARRVDDFGNWSGSTELHDVLSSPWSWGLIPLGLGLLVISIHLLNAARRPVRTVVRRMARDRPPAVTEAAGRWAARGASCPPSAPSPSPGYPADRHRRAHAEERRIAGRIHRRRRHPRSPIEHFHVRPERSSRRRSSALGGSHAGWPVPRVLEASVDGAEHVQEAPVDDARVKAVARSGSRICTERPIGANDRRRTARHGRRVTVTIGRGARSTTDRCKPVAVPCAGEHMQDPGQRRRATGSRWAVASGAAFPRPLIDACRTCAPARSRRTRRAASEICVVSPDAGQAP